MKFLDLTNKRFGRLVVRKLVFRKRGKIFWLCNCICKKKTCVTTSDLTSKKTKSCGCLKKELMSSMKGKKHHQWKGDKVGYFSLHERLRPLIKKPKSCHFCKKKKVLDLANISQKYSTSHSDWMWLCKSCHQRYDRGWSYKGKKWWKICKKCNVFFEVCQKNFYLNKTGIWVPYCIRCCSITHKKYVLQRKKSHS